MQRLLPQILGALHLQIFSLLYFMQLPRIAFGCGEPVLQAMKILALTFHLNVTVALNTGEENGSSGCLCHFRRARRE